ncbi:MAG: Response regulator [Candidatus Aminicenantes bacterium]|nr:Response regulator [Candidatus Aminicenantes bacterium]
MNKPVILVVEDEPLQRRLIRQNLEKEGFAVFEASTGKEALEAVRAYPVDLAVVDYRLEKEKGTDVIREMLKENPLLTTIVVTAFANIENAVEAMRRGAYDYIVKPIDFAAFRLAIDRALERQNLRREVSSLRSSLEEKFSPKNLVLASPRMEEVARLIGKAAKSDATVLISGETGTGKDLVARSIHYSSFRKNGPYLAVNIPALPETLIESELFGAEKGAYTGAHERKIGKFEAASGGTLLLDEIGDLPLLLQVKLLRVLQDGEFFRLGSSKPLRADVRVIAATNRDLERLVREERFRPDLYYRLNVITIVVPPLRERKEDIPPLIDFFIRKFAARERKKINGITREALEEMERYPFPGNVRELENIIERAAVLGEGGFLTLDDLPVFLREKREEDVAAEELPLTERVKRLEVREIRRALLEADGVKSRAARALGISERMLSYKIKVYGLAG